jgi:hypothetical protein
MGEVYFNQVGVTDRTVQLPMPRGFEAANLTKDGVRQLRQHMAGYLMASGVYVPNNLSKWYAAFFGSFGRFITSDMTLAVNGIVNLNQRCATITTGLTYTGLNDFTMGLSINGFVGPENTEYTFSGDAVMVRLTAGVTF